MKKSLIILFALSLQILLIACSKQQTPSPQTTNLTQATINTKIPNNRSPATIAPSTQSNNFSSNNKNPFQAQPNNPSNAISTPAQNINQYSVSDLRMVGTINSDSQQYAIIASPDGSTTTVTVGDKVGKENAEVTNITAEQVILKVTLNFNGSTYEQLVELTLNNQSSQSSSGISA